MHSHTTLGRGVGGPSQSALEEWLKSPRKTVSETEGDTFTITIYIYDYNEKSLHFFSIMTNQDGINIATNEAMMLGIDRTINKTAPFPKSFADQVSNYYDNQQLIEWPKQLGHKIGISR